MTSLSVMVNKRKPKQHIIIDKEITTDDKFRDNSKYFFIKDLVKL